ncbi:hypothetical protein K505DRAFT_316474 [Melanomma pulvis-pyrius CBS 109.77]|uniref:Uncharacterized protein n=1 Tax=Melanomma pulvis-pyrius CBS 109.77 TaxID=1314802 RepID=A0A6A6WUM9_9PLEO|nr:hypothetical protein K505DRAFT_316474 [Melanomma pulvis-pyrius CBS 109.77]
MPELTFVFGPNNTFFFDCPKSWKFHNIPPTLRQLFNASMSPGWRIAQPLCLALGPQINSNEPVWYVSCKVCDGQDKMFYSQTTFDLNYPDLSRWTKTIPNAPRACFVTFGPNLSFFASARGHGSIWAGIPSDLSDKVQKAYDTPNCVSLGMNKAWFVMWPDGYYSWKFYGSYGGLDRILTDAEPRTVSYLAISPFNPEHYFVAFHDRTVRYNFVGCPEWLPQMQEVFTEWQAEILQRQGYQQPYQNQAQPQWNQYSPSPGYLSPPTPGTPLPPYSTPATTNFSNYSPYNATAATFGSQPVISRSSSTDKKRGFLSKRFSTSSAPAAAAVSVRAPNTVTTEGSQTCNVM